MFTPYKYNKKDVHTEECKQRMFTPIDYKDVDEGISLYLTKGRSTTLYDKETADENEDMQRIDGLMQLPEENFEENMHKEFLIAWEREEQRRHTFLSMMYNNNKDNFDNNDIYTGTLRDVPEFLGETMYPTCRENERLQEEYKKRALVEQAWRHARKLEYERKKEEERLTTTRENRRLRTEIVNRKRKSREARIHASSTYERTRKYMAKVRNLMYMEKIVRDALNKLDEETLNEDDVLGVVPEDFEPKLVEETLNEDDVLGVMPEDFEPKLFPPRLLYK